MLFMVLTWISSKTEERNQHRARPLPAIRSLNVMQSWIGAVQIYGISDFQQDNRREI